MKAKFIDNCMTVKTAKDGKLTAVASNATQDRDNEVILPSAFGSHLDRYRANPVILAAHTHRSYDGWPTIIGSADRIEIEKEELVFDMSFAGTDLARQWQMLYEAGHARAFSVGFISMAGEWKESPEGGASIYVHTEVELLEISAVAVPANPDAVARDAAGLDPKELERIVDERIQKVLEKMYAKRFLSLLQ